MLAFYLKKLVFFDTPVMANLPEVAAKLMQKMPREAIAIKDRFGQTVLEYVRSQARSNIVRIIEAEAMEPRPQFDLPDAVVEAIVKPSHRPTLTFTKSDKSRGR